MKERIKEICLHYLTLCKSRDDYTPAMVASELADQILALFPQGEGGLLRDEEICKTACGEYAGKCPARRLNHGCSDFVDIMAVVTKQHDLDQQHEVQALKEQMERVIDKLPEVARQQISQKHSLWFDDVDSTEIDELVDAIVEALKAELEGENE